MGFDSDGGLGGNNEVNGLRENGSLEVGMSSESSSVQRVDFHFDEIFKEADQCLQQVIDYGQRMNGPILNFYFGTSPVPLEMGWGK